MAVDALTGSSMSHQTQAVTHLHRDINRRIVDATCVLRVLEIVEEASQDFNAVNISTAFHRLARMWRDLPDLNSTSNHAQARLDHALQTLMQLAVSHIKEVRLTTLIRLPAVLPSRHYHIDITYNIPVLLGWATSCPEFWLSIAHLSQPSATSEPHMPLTAEAHDQVMQTYSACIHNADNCTKLASLLKLVHHCL